MMRLGAILSIVLSAALSACKTSASELENFLPITEVDPDYDANAKDHFRIISIAEDGQQFPGVAVWKDFECKGRANTDYQVSSIDGRIVAQPITEEARDVPAALLSAIESYVAEWPENARRWGVASGRWLKDFVELPTGWFVAFDIGEFGGSLMWFGRDGSVRMLEPKNTADLILDNGILYAAHGLDHLGTAGGEITARSVPSMNQRFQDYIFRAATPNQVEVIHFDGKRVYGATPYSLVVVDEQLGVHYLVQKQFGFVQQPNSIAVSSEGSVFVGGANVIGVWDSLPETLNPILYVHRDCMPVYENATD